MSGSTWFRLATIPVLVCWLMAAASSVCLGQGKPSPNAAPKKAGCDFLSKSDAESILGTPVESRASSSAQCLFDNGNQAPNYKGVRFSVWYWASPKVNDLAERRKNIEDYPKWYAAGPLSSLVVKDVPDFADAAIWTWFGNGGTLHAFKGGTIQVEASITGLPEDAALQQAKALAAKPLGGTAGTGYVYAAPKLEPPKVAAAPPPPVPTPPPAKDAKPAPPISTATGKTFSQAPYITPSQFLSQVKEVSVTYAVAPSFTKYMSAAEQQRYVASALAQYGIAVRPNAPVTLLVTLDYHPSTIRETTTYTRGPDSVEDYHSHHFFLSLKFFVRAAAWRGGKFHLVAAAPASQSYFFAVNEGSEANKMVFGNKTIPQIKSMFTKYLAEGLKDIASNTEVDDTPWPVSSWSAKQKAAADAEFAKVMSSHSALDKRQIEGIDSVQLELDPDVKDKACEVDPSWRKFWNVELRRLGWVSTQGEAPVMLQHQFWCMEKQVVEFGGPKYVMISDIAYLWERNVVFELNGGLVRKWVLLFSLHRMATPLYKELSATMQGYIPRSIMEFSTDLTLDNQNVPVGAVPSDRGQTIPGDRDRKSPVQPAPGPGKSSETVRPAPVPPPAEGFGDLIGPGGFVRPPPGY